ncbi:hypothetical protein OROMI_013732 [Orobanche minor]
MQRQGLHICVNSTPKCKIQKDLEDVILQCLHPDAMKCPDLDKVEKSLGRVFTQGKGSIWELSCKGADAKEEQVYILE